MLSVLKPCWRSCKAWLMRLIPFHGHAHANTLFPPTSFCLSQFGERFPRKYELAMADHWAAETKAEVKRQSRQFGPTHFPQRAISPRSRHGANWMCSDCAWHAKASDKERMELLGKPQHRIHSQGMTYLSIKVHAMFSSHLVLPCLWILQLPNEHLPILAGS